MDGFIFIWYHAEQTELPWDLPVPMGEIDDTFVYHGHNEFYINCHIQEIPENGADIAHFNAIHKKNFINGSWAQKKKDCLDLDLIIGKRGNKRNNSLIYSHNFFGIWY